MFYHNKFAQKEFQQFKKTMIVTSILKLSFSRSSNFNRRYLGTWVESFFKTGSEICQLFLPKLSRKNWVKLVQECNLMIIALESIKWCHYLFVRKFCISHINSISKFSYKNIGYTINIRNGFKNLWFWFWK